MDKRVAQVGKTFKFNAAKQFSYHPNYQIQEMDIILLQKLQYPFTRTNLFC